jgi:hypothetical protein
VGIGPAAAATATADLRGGNEDDAVALLSLDSVSAAQLSPCLNACALANANAPESLLK